MSREASSFACMTKLISEGEIGTEGGRAFDGRSGYIVVLLCNVTNPVVHIRRTTTALDTKDSHLYRSNVSTRCHHRADNFFHALLLASSLSHTVHYSPALAQKNEKIS